MLEFIGVLLIMLGVLGDRPYYKLIDASPKYTWVERFCIVVLGNLVLWVNTLL